MKILIYGAGVIGCTYGWQLSKAGCDVTVFVRQGKKQSIEESGISIQCTDYREKPEKVEKVVFRPNVIDELLPQNEYDYIIVSVREEQLKGLLPALAQSAGKANILFFQNIWDVESIKNHFATGCYFFGFPFMAGGGRKDKTIYSIIADSKYSKTMLGETNGEVTPRITEIANVMEKAGMKPFVSEQIVNWLIPHYVFIAGLSAGIIASGGNMKSFTGNPKIVKKSIKAIREGFQICEQRGINPKKEKVNKLYYLPLFICSPIVRKLFSNEVMASMFEGYLRCSTEEVKNMLEKIIASGEKYNIETPYMKEFQKNIVNHL